ncbi:MAG: hypothetical protein FWE02_03950, partial [Defluviitaleaceae bacterium]|nr:hypothetical protein [Defluviitaleaceae bacterium]
HLHRGVNLALEGLEPALRVEAVRRARRYGDPPEPGWSPLVTFEMMRDFGWPEDKLTPEYISNLNDVLRRFDITDRGSIRLFMATVRHESNGGRNTLELLQQDGTTGRNYGVHERGAGYMQLTWDDTHRAFLEFIGSFFYRK